RQGEGHHPARLLEGDVRLIWVPCAGRGPFVSCPRLERWVPAFAGISKRRRELTVISADLADGAAAAEGWPLLAVNNIEVIYNRVVLLWKGVSLTVRERAIVALLGANGAGKTTSLKAISNLLRAERGEV